ncbi:Uncharacterized protein FKW44_009776, partial [Caligus rogercresseyi]
MVSVNFKPSRVKKPIAAPPPSASMDDDLEALERRPRGEDPSSAKEDKKPLVSTAASSSSSGLLPPALLDILQHHRGPCTPPPPTTIQESIDVPKGPQTPPSDHSYDPCNPTLSPNINEEDTEQHENGEHIRNNNNGVVSSSNWTDSPEEDKETQQPPTSSSSSIPIIPFFDSSSYTNNATSSHAEKKEGLSGKDLEGSAVDMDMDSPFSPQSSDMSDIFEPPLNTPLTNKLILKRNKGKTGKPKNNPITTIIIIITIK